MDFAMLNQEGSRALSELGESLKNHFKGQYIWDTNAFIRLTDLLFGNGLFRLIFGAIEDADRVILKELFIKWNVKQS